MSLAYSRAFLVALFVCLGSWLSPSIYAQSTWTGEGGDPYWDNPENWSPEGAPGLYADVSIPQANDSVIIRPTPQAPRIGSIDCKGTLQIDGVGVEIGGGSVIEKGLFLTNGATVHVKGPNEPGFGLTVGTSLNPLDTVLQLSGGWIRIDNALTVRGQSTFNGRIEGPGTLELIEASTFDSISSTDLHDAIVINRGACLIRGSADFSSPTPSVVHNYGTMTFQLAANFAKIEVHNHGTIQVDIATIVDPLVIDWPFVQYPTGAIDVQRGHFHIHNGTNGDSIDGQITVGSDCVLSLNGQHQLEQTLTVTGAGELRLAAPAPGMTVRCPVIDVAKVILGVAGAPVRFEDGTIIETLVMEPGAKLGGAGLVTILDSFTASGSTQIVDSGILALAGGCGGDIQSDAQFGMSDTRQFINQGTLSLGSNCAFTTSGTPEFTNQGTMTCSDGSVQPSGSIRNTGDVVKTGTGTMRVQCDVTNLGQITIEDGVLQLTRGGIYSGQFDVQSGGTLHLQGGSPDIHDFGANSSITGDGTLLAGGDATIAGTLAVNTLECPVKTLTLDTDATLNSFVLRGGTIRGTGNIAVSDSTELTAGYLFGDAAVDANGSLMINATATLKIGENRVLTNFGQGIWAGGSLGSQGTATFVNAPGANMDITTSGDWRIHYENHGTTTKSAGGNVNIHGPIDNSGQIIISAGSITAFQGFTQTSGLLQLNGATFGANIFNEAPLEFNGGTLLGDGTVKGVVHLGAGSKLEPGGSNATGTLAITLDLLHDDGADIVLELAGPADSDSVTVGREAAVDGLVRVGTISGYAPALGDAFRLMSFATSGGAFDEVSLPPLTQPKHRWQVDTDGASLAVSVTGAQIESKDGPVEVDPDQ